MSVSWLQRFRFNILSLLLIFLGSTWPPQKHCHSTTPEGSVSGAVCGDWHQANDHILEPLIDVIITTLSECCRGKGELGFDADNV